MATGEFFSACFQAGIAAWVRCGYTPKVHCTALTTGVAVYIRTSVHTWHARCAVPSANCAPLLVLQIEELQTQKGAQTAVEARASALDEKYSKLKSVYTKLREEHIELLRANGETKKQVVLLTESEKEAQEKMEVSSGSSGLTLPGTR